MTNPVINNINTDAYLLSAVGAACLRQGEDAGERAAIPLDKGHRW